jgi:hypothetical protein
MTIITYTSSNDEPDSQSTTANANEVEVSIILENGGEMKFRKHDLMHVSEYFASMFSRNDFEESISNQVNFAHLNQEAIHFVLDSLITYGNTSTIFCSKLIDRMESKRSLNYECINKWEDDYTTILHVADYLQVNGVSGKDFDLINQTVEVLKHPEIVREECKKQGWASSDSPFRITCIPHNKKKREWRFWVFYVLCIDMMPIANERVEPSVIAQTLIPLGDAIAIRRELVEYGLIQREGDGSAYWRPSYTLPLIYNQLQQQDSRTFQRRII